MKKFVFSLQALLNINRSLEKQQKNALAAINNEIERLNNEREILMSEIDDNNNIYMILIEGMIKINHIRNRREYLKHLRGQLSSLDETLLKKEEQKEKLLAEIVETMSKRKSLEKLKEKQYKKFLAEENRKNEVVVEDFASYSYIKSNQWGVELEQTNY